MTKHGFSALLKSKKMKLVGHLWQVYCSHLRRPSVQRSTVLLPALWRLAITRARSVPGLCIPSRYYAKKAKKRVGGGSSGSSLSEEEREVIDLGRVESSMQAAVTALTREFNNTLVTRLTPASLDKLCIELDGQSTPLRHLGQVSMPNSSTLLLNLASYPQAIDQAVDALRSHTLNLGPIVDKNVIKVPVPKMNKELREKMVKQAKVYAEKAKVGIRKVRQKAITDIRKENVSEDTTRKIENHIQELTDASTKSVDSHLVAKSKELLAGF